MEKLSFEASYVLDMYVLPQMYIVVAMCRPKQSNVLAMSNLNP